MKQNLILSISFLIVVIQSIGQVNILWESRLDYNNLTDFVRDIEIDASGNSYVTGTALNGSNFDIVTVKYDPDGNEIWTNIYNGPVNGWDDVTGLRLDGNGDVLIGGFHQVGANDYDIMGLKLDGTNGNQMWVYTYNGTANFDLCNGISIDGNNNLILAGAEEFSATDQDFVTISVSPGGAQNWVSTYTPVGRDVINAVTCDALNNVYVTGESNDASNNLDFYTIKYNSSGSQVWFNRYDGMNSIDSPKAITVDLNGNVYVVGTSYRDVVIEEDIMLLKLSSTGVPQWDAVIGGTSEDFDSPSDVTCDNLGNIYLTGKIKNLGNGEDYLIARYRPNGSLHWSYLYQSSTNGYDEGKRIIVNNNYEIFSSGYSNLTGNNDDYLTLKLDTLGNEIWNTRFNGPASASDQMVDFEIDTDGNIFVSGSSVGSGTNRDYSTIKYCQLETVASAVSPTICIGQSVQLNASGGFNFQWSVLTGEQITGSNFTCTACDNPVASPTETTTYQVSSENTAGCQDIDTITIVVNPLPGPVVSTNGPTTFCDGGSVTLTADFAPSYNWSNGLNTQSFTTDTSGLYTLTITDAMGCQNSTNIEVTVNPLPVVLGGPDKFRCPGEELTLTATGADSLAWYKLPLPSAAITNGETLIPSTSGSYMVIGIDENGCQDQDTINLTIYPFPSQIELTQGMSGNLFVNLNDGLTEWFLDGINLNHNGTSFFYDSVPYCNGLYSVVYTDENGCQTFDEITVTDACQGDTTGSIDLISQVWFNVFPNPTSNYSTIQFQDKKERRISILDLNGRILAEHITADKQFQLNMENLAMGTYYILITDHSTRYLARLVKL